MPRAERYGRLMQVVPLATRADLWTDEAKAEIGPLASPGILLGPAPRPGIAGLQQLDLVTYLPGDLLPKSDIASMAHSLELRSPLLDHRVVELGLSLPEQLKSHGTRRRRSRCGARSPRSCRRPSRGAARPASPSRSRAGSAASCARSRASCSSTSVRGTAAGSAPTRSSGCSRSTRRSAQTTATRSGRSCMLELWQRTHVEAAAPVSVP